MSQARPMTKRSQRMMLSAVERISELVDEQGIFPVDAVVKTAREFNLTPDLTRILVQSYNVGRTLDQQDRGTSILSKHAEFPVVRIEDVLAGLYPEQVKSAAETQREDIVDPCYSQPPKQASAVTGSGQHWEWSFQRQAAPTTDKWTEKSGQVREITGGVERALREVTEDRRQAQMTKRAADAAASRARDRLLTKLSRVVGHFKSSPADRDQWPDIQHNAELLFGPPVSHVFEYVAQSCRMPQHVKRSSRLLFADPQTAPYRQIGEVLEAGRDWIRLHGEALKAAEAAAVAEAAVPECMGEKPPEPPEKKAFINLGHVVSTAVGAGLRGTATGASQLQSAYDKATETLSDPGLEDEMREIQVRTMLSDLLNNDEIIRGYDPEDVVDAYNEIAQLSPRTALQPALVRPFIRKRLSQGGIAPFEAEQLANVEKTLTQTSVEGMPKPPPAPQPIKRASSRILTNEFHLSVPG